MNESDRMQVQRLVDGELNRQQTRGLLQQAETDAGLYRQIALAMVEQQVLVREMNALEGLGGRTGVGCGNGSTVLSADSPPVVPVHGSRSGGTSGIWSRGPFGQLPAFLATAAALLLMTWVGYRIGQAGLGGGSGSGGAVSGTGLASGQVAPLLIQPRSEQDAWERYAPYRMQMVSNEGGTLEEIPVMPISMAREMGLQYDPAPIPEDLQRRFNRQGYRVQPEIQYISGQMPDGRQVVVPVQKNRVTPYGQ